MGPPEFTAVTITVYGVFADKLVKMAVFDATPLSVEGVVGVPFREYV